MSNTPESEEKKEERIDLAGHFQMYHALDSGGGILDEPFEARPMASLKEVLSDAQRIANQTTRRVFFRFNDTLASVDRYMKEELVGQEDELTAKQKDIVETARQLREVERQRALTPEELAAWQKELRKHR